MLTLITVSNIGTAWAQDTAEVGKEEVKEEKEKDTRPVRSIFESAVLIDNQSVMVPQEKTFETAENAYSAIIAGGYINTLVPVNSILYGEVKSGDMPPTGPLKPADIQKILDWIRNGAKNN